MWDDDDFIALSALAKLVYVQLCMQRKLEYSGELTVSVKRWSKAHPDQDTDTIRAALAELDAARFVVVDQDTDELLIRSFIRSDQLYKQPNVLRAALRSAFEISSPLLRRALASELRRLPVEITGPAPAVAAIELEAGARELPASVKAAMSVRGSTRTAPTPAPPAPAVHGHDDAHAEPFEPVPAPAVNPSPNPSGNPSPNPSANPSPRGRGEGSREMELGVVPLTLVKTQVGVPAPAPTHTSADMPARTREAAPLARVSAEVSAVAGVDGELEASSVRQLRRREAERLVSTHCPRQPRQVLDRLRGEVIGLLRDDVEPAAIASGLRLWAGKQLSTSMLAELVGEAMRARCTAASPEARRREQVAAANWEAIRADAIADDDTSPIGLAVRGELPGHADAATLDAILERALHQAVGLDTSAGENLADEPAHDGAENALTGAAA
ncbi:hypothetical protein SAMN04488074_108222 [Lentzea albidocapillata subsp. violacea]|uniref:Uncharacterized protein n=1 Tax=Lentzea albidocapillata subsp. violacea TaxID=128104 RepID=A0A1G9GIE7_9PSEU|nr:hypothetical protein [Lentzea albidocapillata]SDL00469.1 hypothetical protein SAMN04488074_108222 [Lentzea albidocapillata subsp. violacea]